MESVQVLILAPEGAVCFTVPQLCQPSVRTWVCDICEVLLVGQSLISMRWTSQSLSIGT